MGKKSIFQNIRVHLNTYMHKLHINRKYRDRLFCALFSQDREALLQLYNALHGTAYTDSSQLTVVTLDNIIYMKMVNDLAFVIAGVLNLYEHQSTYNPNMPLRLSDAFQNKNIPSDLELTVHLRNINLGHNRALMNQCPKLWEYASLVGRINENLEGGMTKEAAVEEAVAYCIDQGILTDFLKENRSGVLGMLRLLTEYNEKEHMRRLKRDAREEGMLQDRVAVITEFLSELGEVSSELQTIIAKQTDLSVLRKWCHIAANSKSIEEFEETILRP